MTSTRLISDGLVLPELPTQSSYPMDSSRVLLGLMTLAKHAADHSQSNDPLDGVIPPSVLRSLLSALQLRDGSTVRHARRVALLATGIAERLGWEGRQLKVLEVAALLHDIGKIGVPDNILFKPGPLSPDEAELMSLHNHIGVDVLQACRVDGQVLEIVGESHSDYDGAALGSRRLRSELPLGARILAVADAYDSLSTDQAYRRGKSHAEIMKILMDHAGTQFDGNIVCTLSRWAQEANPAFLAHSLGEPGQGTVASPPAPPDEAAQAATLCHIFSYLYVLESLYDGFYLVDSDLRFVVWNRGAENLLGYPMQQMLSHVWTSRLLAYADRSGKPYPDHECPMHQVVATSRASTSQLKLRDAEGKWKEVEVQTVPLLDQYQRLQGVAEIFRDLRRQGRRPQEYRALRVAATRDPLTNVANRGELERQLAMLLSDYAERPEDEIFSMIFLDIDHFKPINDRFGHAAGDAALIHVARLLQHETYSGELVGRYGGEEFVILCPGTEQTQAFKRAERLRLAISRTRISELEGHSLTASLGVTQVEPGDSVESVLRRADKALYTAKDGGRNQTRALTSVDLLSSPGFGSAISGGTNAFVHYGTFHAVVAAEMIAYKLGGFVRDQRARLVEVSAKRAVVRIGQPGLLRFWGRSDDHRPVEIELTFGESQSGPGPKRRSSNQVEVRVTIRPRGWIRNPEVFHARARRVFQELRGYFVAESRM